MGLARVVCKMLVLRRAWLELRSVTIQNFSAMANSCSRIIKQMSGVSITDNDKVKFDFGRDKGRSISSLIGHPGWYMSERYICDETKFLIVCHLFTMLAAKVANHLKKRDECHGLLYILVPLLAMTVQISPVVPASNMASWTTSILFSKLY